MELDSDLGIQRDKLERSIRKYKNWAVAFAVVAFSPFFVAGYYNFTNPHYLFIEETGSYIGGFSAPFASLAGIFFVYVAFLGQRLQIIYQQQELRTNQKELQDTRKELRGQKQQLKRQNQQFKNQSFDNMFFNLLSFYNKFIQTATVLIENRNVTIKGLKEKLDDDFRTVSSEIDPDSETYGVLISRPREYTDEELKEAFYNRFNQSSLQIKNLFKPLLSILFIISTADIEHEEKYNHILDSQVTETEKFILFYFFVLMPSTTWTQTERLFVYTFLERIDGNTLIKEDHFFWLHQRPYIPSSPQDPE